MANRIVIIGANAAGVNAAIAARKTERDAEITLVTDEEYATYSRCGLPYVLAGNITQFEDLIMFKPSFYKTMRIDLWTKMTVKSIDLQERTINAICEDGRAESIPYNSLVMACGASPFILPFKGYDKEGVFSLRTIEDGRRIQKAMIESKKAVVIGATPSGLQLASVFLEKGIETTVVDRGSHIMPATLDKDMADVVKKRIEESGAQLIVGAAVEEITGNKRVKGVKVAGKTIDADIVLMTTGVRPRSGLAQQLGCECGLAKAVKVDPQMRTTIAGVYAAGDCVETQNMITGLPTLMQLGTIAIRQGKVAGINAAGGYAIFPGALGSSVSKMFGFEVGSTGLIELQAKRAGLATVSAVLNTLTRPEYFPGAKEIRVKITAEKESGRVVGGQVVGGEDVVQKVNMISLAIQSQATVWELSKVDTCYSPPVADMWEPVALTAELANLRLRHD